MVEVKIKDVIVDAEVYPRTQDVWQKVYEYSMAMKAGATFPPVIVGKYRNQLILIDGLHRIKASKLLDRITIEATIKPYSNKKQMFIDAVKFNNIHGKPLTVMDKTLIFSKLRNWQVTDSEISLLLGTPIDRFSVYITRLVGADGKEKPIKSIIAENLKNQRITETDAIHMSFPYQKQNVLISHDCLHALNQLINMIQNNLVPFDDKDNRRT